MTEPTAKKSMDEIMALCKRRGFIFQASEIYGGINGFWDYGPLGAQLKKNLKDAWWQDTVTTPPVGPDGKPVSMVGLDSCIIQNPKVWVASGHVGGFNDPMIDCRESKRRYRADHLWVAALAEGPQERFYAFVEGDDEGRDRALKLLGKYTKRQLGDADVVFSPLGKHPASALAHTVGPDTKEVGTLTEPRAFNLMFKTYVGATASEDDVAYLRPETAQGIFLNFKNVTDTTRVKMPFGIAQIGKAFRNEVTPRNFTFRSREFEQMEIEFFCAPGTTNEWYAFWRDLRMRWWQSLGLASDNLVLREHDRDELAHYAKTGAGTSDIEYRFPFTYPGFGELEGVADRSDFDLKQHAQHSKTKLEWFDPEAKERYVPHVIEPSAGADRGVLALLCEAYTPDPSRPSKVYMKFAPRLSPLKAGVFPLVAKDGMPEIAEKLYQELKPRFGAVEFDAKQTIGKRYARMDEAGCPFCFTIDSDTAKDQSVTVRERDTCAQERVALDKVSAYLAERIFV
ncbi:MAG TPA: glycine--tRNA ligase [Polyangiaceae bacterium]|nr:glycine--tRNA ligase [Polyangiaceae bacterium]